MDVALTLICLREEQVGDMPSNVILIADCVTTEDLLKTGKD